MKIKTAILTSFFLTGLTACGSGSDTDSQAVGNNSRLLGISDDPSCVSSESLSVQWETLKTTNAEKLSDYQLFSNPCDPTKNPNNRGLPYDLSVPLFTDYATKYRFVFIPEGEKAVYDADEVFNFPVGSVLSKTFTLPVDTSNRSISSEEVIETRLLIKRESGWVTLPYIWNNDKTEAILSGTGKIVSTSLTHNTNELEFDYGVPTSQQCIKCHQIDNGTVNGAFPIGPKARYLNSNFDYGNGPKNQIQKWFEEGFLSDVPESASTIDSVPVYSDDIAFEELDTNTLDSMARAWLDINCAHCHREEGGNAENTNFNSLWNFSGALETCNQPISYGGEGLSWIISPGKADESILIQRMEAVPDGSGDQMPPIGRDLAHTEGIELVKAWINASNETPCRD